MFHSSVYMMFVRRVYACRFNVYVALGGNWARPVEWPLAPGRFSRLVEAYSAMLGMAIVNSWIHRRTWLVPLLAGTSRFWSEHAAMVGDRCGCTAGGLFSWILTYLPVLWPWARCISLVEYLRLMVVESLTTVHQAYLRMALSSTEPSSLLTRHWLPSGWPSSIIWQPPGSVTDLLVVFGALLRNWAIRAV